MVRGVHGLGWVRLRGFFDPTHRGGLKNIQPNPNHHISPTQSNPYGSGWVGLNPWIEQFFLLLLLLN